MTDDTSKTRLSRRKMIRKVGAASVVGTAAISLASAPVSALSKGQRVSDGDGNDSVSVFARPDASSNYLGRANGGPYNPPFGTITSTRRRDNQANVYMWEVNWDYSGDPDGWCIRAGLSPVSVPLKETPEDK